MGFTKIDVRPILRAHARTLRHAETGKPLRGDQFLHFGMPIAVGVLAFYLGVEFKEGTKGLIVTVVALVAGGLFNLLVLASGMRLANRGSYLFGASRRLSRETLANIEYSIFVAFLAAAVIVPSMIDVSIPLGLIAANDFALRLCYSICCACIASLGVSSLMVMRRMHQAMIQNLEVTYNAADPVPQRRLRHQRYRSPDVSRESDRQSTP